MNNYRRFNLAFLGITVPGLLTVGLFNAGIDPYGVMNSPEILGLNRLKTQKFNHVRLFKAIAVTRVEPKTLLLGSSRSDLGLDPNHPALNAESAYNLALVGPNMYEVKRYFDHAIANQPEVKTVILGLDFFMFNQFKNNQADFSETRLEKETLMPKEFLNVTFSLGATRSSLETIQSSLNADANFLYQPNGLRYVYENEPERPITEEFANMMGGFMEREGYYKEYELSQEFLGALRDLVEIAKSRDIELKLFISPAHAAQWETLRLAGLWPEFEQWKREVVKIAPVWDFSGYNSITTESIDREMNYYWDSSHYRESVGDLIINRLFDYQTEKVPSDFGVVIDAESVESHLQNIRRDREAWVTHHPEVVRWVKELKPTP
ncbi:hypothetical protein [Phormidium sp. CCY1219]|uniref:hypothetical protein n=1 Tax=Phormidium sp. CCY1219 TaxID=2886104 RepID=UPI002D1F0098|nr:hypothetical protein [Phormidium sp. CCY1219]MEB3828329.1 hypothetical protein [Phormidium sp. CCY1219]